MEIVISAKTVVIEVPCGLSDQTVKAILLTVVSLFVGHLEGFCIRNNFV